MRTWARGGRRAPLRVRGQHGAARAGDRARCPLHHGAPRGPGAAGDCRSKFDSRSLAEKIAVHRFVFEANLCLYHENECGFGFFFPFPL